MRYVSLLLAAVCLLANTTYAQKCGTNLMYDRYLRQYPQIVTYQQQMEQEYQAALKQLDMKKFLKTTDADTVYDIPVVVHIIHDYGAEFLPDDSIYNMVKEMTATYSLNYDTSGVIAPFKQYVGKANIHFHLATVDPVGNPTKGITRHYSYLTNGGDDQAKLDLWDPAAYYNIWIENHIGLGVPGGEVLAYATFPSSSAADPYHDGVIAGYQFVNPNPYGPLTIEHETGHYFNLLHPWNNNGSGDGACGTDCGDDEVDDTPPTVGHCSTCNLYDSMCASGYVKVYPSANGIDSIQDYPDTTNVQNIMDYSSCPLMFTRLQVVRMHAALNSSIASRNNLWNADNLLHTGALVTVPDLAPIVEYSVNNPFVCENRSVSFKNFSWNDTITSVNWQFPSYASVPTSTSKTTVNVAFSQPGWVHLTLSATGNNSGTSTLVDSQRVYVADANATNAQGYFQEFNPNGDLSHWPMFNYFNNNFHWQLVNNAGYYDNTSIMYTGFDTRLDPVNSIYPPTGMPKGDYDDLFTPAFDLTTVDNNTSDPVSLNFMYSGTSRTSNTADMTDTLEIDYMTDCATWHVLKYLTKQDIANRGVSSTAYTPQSGTQWSLQSIALPTAAVTSSTFFRFRYKPGVFSTFYTTGASPYSTGNNFYMDRINFSNYPLGLNTLLKQNDDVEIAPNPTTGDAYAIVKNSDNVPVTVSVSDITGRILMNTRQTVNGIARITIPRKSLGAAGMYLVHISWAGFSNTRKLIVD